MSRVKRMPPAKIRTYRVGCPYCRSIRKKGPSLIELRVMGVEGERDVSLETAAELLLHPGDTISLSYPRVSTGVFKRKWTGEYSSAPVALWNNTTQKGWRL